MNFERKSSHSHLSGKPRFRLFSLAGRPVIYNAAIKVFIPSVRDILCSMVRPVANYLCFTIYTYLRYNAIMFLVNLKAEALFQALADPTRIRLVRLLASSGEEACLCECVDSLLEPPYKLSRHLKVLRQAGLLSSEKDGRWVYHRLVKDKPHLERLYAMILELPDTDQAFAKDMERLHKRMKLREDGRCRIGIRQRRAERAGGIDERGR